MQTPFILALALSSLYYSLNPTSIREHLAFAELYPEEKEGMRAKEKAIVLLTKHAPRGTLVDTSFRIPELSLPGLLSLTHLYPEQEFAPLSDSQKSLMNSLCNYFPNRRLKGFYVTTPEALDALPAEEIDLARALLLIEYAGDEKKAEKIANYEMALDFMALEVLAKLDHRATDLEKVRAMNEYIFHDLKFRFPPHSLHAKNIDEYTFLPSVMDNRLGVCLGVSILYLSISQRIGLPLEIVTPPGHIYVRYNDGEKKTVIETTARGISMPEDVYLSVNTKSLELRNIKEVVGFAFFNQAAVSLHRQKFKQARDRYAIAKRFIKDDHLLDKLYGITLIITGNEKEGRKQLEAARAHPSSHDLFQGNLIDEYLSGNLSTEALSGIFSEVDDTRESILKKKEELKQFSKKNPKSTELIFALATCYLQLNRPKEAMEYLKRYTHLEKNNPTVYYYLSILASERYDYPGAWHYLELCSSLCEKQGHKPKALSQLAHRLGRIFPKPIRQRNTI